MINVVVVALDVVISLGLGQQFRRRGIKCLRKRVPKVFPKLRKKKKIPTNEDEIEELTSMLMFTVAASPLSETCRVRGYHGRATMRGRSHCDAVCSRWRDVREHALQARKDRR